MSEKAMKLHKRLWEDTDIINYEYIWLENMVRKHCPKCLRLLFNEIYKFEADYPYVCVSCDENFFNFESEEENNDGKIIK